jgi:hypothetical protein
MASPSTSHALTDLESVSVLNEVLNNENIGEFSLDDDGVFDSDYTQLMTPGTHVIAIVMDKKKKCKCRIGTGVK